MSNEAVSKLDQEPVEEVRISRAITLEEAPQKVQEAVLNLRNLQDDVGAVRSTVTSKLARDLGISLNDFDELYGHLFIIDNRPTVVTRAETPFFPGSAGKTYGHF